MGWFWMVGFIDVQTLTQYTQYIQRDMAPHTHGGPGCSSQRPPAMLVLCHSVNRSPCSYQAYIYKARCSRCHDEIWTCIYVCVCVRMYVRICMHIMHRNMGERTNYSDSEWKTIHPTILVAWKQSVYDRKSLSAKETIPSLVAWCNPPPPMPKSTLWCAWECGLGLPTILLEVV